MKKIITTNLNKRFPANENFLQYIDTETRNYLIALLSSLHPDSDNRAYILAGLEPAYAPNLITFSQGFVFYQNEIFFVPAFNIARDALFLSEGLAIQTNITTDTYGSGQILPAFENRILVYTNAATYNLRFIRLKRKNWDFESLEEEIIANAPYLVKKDAKVVQSIDTQMLLMHLQILPSAATINTGISFLEETFSKFGLIGLGKIINKTTHKNYDVCVYRVANRILIKRPYDAEPATTSNTLKWSELWSYANPISEEEAAGRIISGGEVGSGAEPGEPVEEPAAPPQGTDPLVLYVNLTHKK